VWGGYVNLGGVPAQARNEARTPSKTPAEAKAKGRVNLPKDTVDRLKTTYLERLQTGALKPKLPLKVQPAKPSATQTTQAAPSAQQTAAQQTAAQQTAVQGKNGSVSVALPKGFQPLSQGDPRWKTLK